MGLWTSLQAGLEPSVALKGHLLGASLVRATAPAASGSASLLALLLWAHPLRPAAVQAQLRRTSLRVAAVSIPGYLVAAGVALLTGWALLGAVLAVPVLGGVSAPDFALGAAYAAVDAALILALAWRFLPRLQQTSLSLPAKLSLAFAVTVPLRATVGLVAANVLSP